MKLNAIPYAVVTILFLFALGIFFERPAYAYADPGSSLLMFQGVSAAVSGALFFFRRRLRNLLTRSKVDNPGQDSAR